MGRIETALRDLGIVLPNPVAPVANYLPAIRSGSLVFVAGQLCFGADGQIANAHRGKLGVNVTDLQVREAAGLCAIDLLAQLKGIVGDLDHVAQCVLLGGFINSQGGNASLAQVMNGASDLLLAVFGERGRHARTTVGVAELPLDAVIEIDAVFQVE